MGEKQISGFYSWYTQCEHGGNDNRCIAFHKCSRKGSGRV